MSKFPIEYLRHIKGEKGLLEEYPILSPYMPLATNILYQLQLLHDYEFGDDVAENKKLLIAFLSNHKL